MTEIPKVKPGAKGCKGCGRVLYVTDPDYCPDCAHLAPKAEPQIDTEKVKRLVDEAIEKGVR